MKLNQKLITQLRNGEIAVENSGTLKQLTEVLREAFPEDNVRPEGDCQYYSLSAVWRGLWTGFWFKDESKSAFKISDFYQPELFTGWAKDDRYPKWMFYFKDDVSQFGFDGDGFWHERFGNFNYTLDDEHRPATHEEIESTLIKEAKRIGYKGGDTIKGIHGTMHFPEEISFHYEIENNRLETDECCVVFENGQWAEIVEQPKPQPLHYNVEGVVYSLDYQELKHKYQEVVNYSNEQFMDNLPEIAHLACIISYFKGLGNNATIGDKGIIHELIHLMTDKYEPTNDLKEIRDKFNRLIKLA